MKAVNWKTLFKLTAAVGRLAGRLASNAEVNGRYGNVRVYRLTRQDISSAINQFLRGTVGRRRKEEEVMGRRDAFDRVLFLLLMK